LANQYNIPSIVELLKQGKVDNKVIAAAKRKPALVKLLVELWAKENIIIENNN